MPSLGGERGSVQNPLIRYAKEVGWEFVSQEDALRLRGGETGLVFRDLFMSQLLKLNPDFMDEEKAKELIKQLERIPPTIEGNLVAWEYLKGLKTVFVQRERRERNVKFIDADNIKENKFHVTDEFIFTNGSKTIRPDVVFLINGVPVLFVETKAAHKLEGLSEALVQIKRYHRECPELLAILQVYALTHIVRYYYSSTWNTSEKYLFNWKDEVKGDYETLVKTFLDKKRVIRLLTDFILFTRQDDELTKVVLRPHQMRAVDKLVERALDSVKKRGLIWHTQGSGKTYTMIVAAKKILDNPLFKKPTVLMLVDRNELETQMFGNLAACGFESVEVADSKRELQKLLSEGKQGLIVSMIHKFENMQEKISTRENIFVLIDEAHRTTTGKLGNYLMGALPNATYIGFTGTPIDRTTHGGGTFIVFGKDDPPKGYLDKYSISESIEDGTTVPLHYTLAPNELQVDRQVLEKEFLDLAESEGVSDVEQLNKILEKAVTLRNMMKNKERVQKIAKYVADHYKTHIEPLGYKAFLVAVDREACALYKKELDKYLPKDYSTVIYSPNYNDEPELSQHHLGEEEEKRIRKAFRKADQLPKILIVTEKLLTGFDAPVLYCMYLDKPMRDHVLLQAIARVNRPYEDGGRKKPCGFVLDFVGIFDRLEKALAFDSQDIKDVVKDIEVLKGRFADLMKKAKTEYLSMIRGKSSDKAVEAVLEGFMDEKARHTFYEFFRETADIYDIVSPDAFLRPYIDDMETLARMYRILKEAYESGISVDGEFSKKTAELVQEKTKSGMIKPTLDVYEINEETLKKIEGSKSSDTEKVFNLLKSIRTTIQDNVERSPYLLSIGEKAEAIVMLYKDRQQTTQETLENIKNLVNEINTSRKEQEEKNMPAEVFTIFWVLKHKGIKSPEDKANLMRKVLEKYPHWKRSESHEREVKQELYKVLLPAGGGDMQKVTDIAQEIMRTIKGGYDANT